ncbi:MAG: hypothetical protein EBZ69_01355 [Alphaproteobacteria bacterium]|nr:hypothetical protein [Alphaproteobacteria bacterium]
MFHLLSMLKYLLMMLQNHQQQKYFHYDIYNILLNQKYLLQNQSSLRNHLNMLLYSLIQFQQQPINLRYRSNINHLLMMRILLFQHQSNLIH